MTLKDTSNTNSLDRSFVESIDLFLDELTSSSSNEPVRTTFYQRLVNRLQTIIGADEVSVWAQGPDQTCIPAITSVNSHGSGNQQYRLKDDQFDQVFDATEPLCVKSNRKVVFAASIDSENAHRKVMVLVCTNELGSQLEKVYCDLVEAIADIATGFERRLLVENQQQKFTKLETFVQLLNNAHSTLDLEKVGYHLANDCRQFLNADRVWVFTFRARPQLVSCSSVSDVNPRSKTLRTLTPLISEAVRNGQSSCFVRGESASDSPTRCVKNYMELEPVNGIYVMLLKHPEKGNIAAVLFAECFEDHDRLSMLAGLNNIVPCVESALTNSMAYTNLPFRRPMVGLGWILERFKINVLPKTMLILIAMAAVLASLFLVQTDFELDVQGELRPAVERHVFAPTDSLAASVLVDYGDKVEVGQPLVRLVSQGYELEIGEQQNKLSAAAKKLEANQILRTQASQEGKDSLHLGQLTAEIEQNRLEIESINQRIAWYLEKMETLNVISPIAGKVTSRDVRLSLLNRPVSRGSRLLTIADTGDVWQIVLDIPDREYGYMLLAKEANDVDTWDVNYRLKTDLTELYHATIEHTDDNNSVDKNGEVFVRAFVPFDGKAAGEMRVGQSVVGKVYCGKKSLFFVWTRDVRDFLRTNFFWF